MGASDLHLKAGNVPFVRVDGELSQTAFGAMSAADTEAAALALMPEHERRAFEATNEADFGYTLAGVGRFGSTSSTTTTGRSSSSARSGSTRIRTPRPCGTSCGRTPT